MAVPSSSFPIYERLCGFQPSAFQPYLRANVDLLGANQVCSQQAAQQAVDTNLISYCDPLKTFTELKSVPVNVGFAVTNTTQTNVTDLARLTLREPIPLRVLPNSLFQPFGHTAAVVSQCEQLGNSGAISNSNSPDALTQSLTAKPQVIRRSKELARQKILPSVDSDIDEDTLYVNAKQFSRILRRREARMKLEREGRISRIRKKYLHESRHLHALTRMRGRGGKFGKRNDTAVFTQKWEKFHVPQIIKYHMPQVRSEPSFVLKTVVKIDEDTGPYCRKKRLRNTK